MRRSIHRHDSLQSFQQPMMLMEDRLRDDDTDTLKNEQNCQQMQGQYDQANSKQGQGQGQGSQQWQGYSNLNPQYNSDLVENLNANGQQYQNRMQSPSGDLQNMSLSNEHTMEQWQNKYQFEGTPNKENDHLYGAKYQQHMPQNTAKDSDANNVKPLNLNYQNLPNSLGSSIDSKQQKTRDQTNDQNEQEATFDSFQDNSQNIDQQVVVNVLNLNRNLNDKNSNYKVSIEVSIERQHDKYDSDKQHKKIKHKNRYNRSQNRSNQEDPDGQRDDSIKRIKKQLQSVLDYQNGDITENMRKAALAVLQPSNKKQLQNSEPNGMIKRNLSNNQTYVRKYQGYSMIKRSKQKDNDNNLNLARIQDSSSVSAGFGNLDILNSGSLKVKHNANISPRANGVRDAKKSVSFLDKLEDEHANQQRELQKYRFSSPNNHQRDEGSILPQIHSNIQTYGSEGNESLLPPISGGHGMLESHGGQSQSISSIENTQQDSRNRGATKSSIITSNTKIEALIPIVPQDVNNFQNQPETASIRIVDDQQIKEQELQQRLDTDEGDSTQERFVVDQDSQGKPSLKKRLSHQFIEDLEPAPIEGNTDRKDEQYPGNEDPSFQLKEELQLNTFDKRKHSQYVSQLSYLQPITPILSSQIASPQQRVPFRQQGMPQNVLTGSKKQIESLVSIYGKQMSIGQQQQFQFGGAMQAMVKTPMKRDNISVSSPKKSNTTSQRKGSIGKKMKHNLKKQKEILQGQNFRLDNITMALLQDTFHRENSRNGPTGITKPSEYPVSVQDDPELQNVSIEQKEKFQEQLKIKYPRRFNKQKNSEASKFDKDQNETDDGDSASKANQSVQNDQFSEIRSIVPSLGSPEKHDRDGPLIYITGGKPVNGRVMVQVDVDPNNPIDHEAARLLAEEYFNQQIQKFNVGEQMEIDPAQLGPLLGPPQEDAQNQYEEQLSNNDDTNKSQEEVNEEEQKTPETPPKPKYAMSIGMNQKQSKLKPTLQQEPQSPPQQRSRVKKGKSKTRVNSIVKTRNQQNNSHLEMKQQFKNFSDYAEHVAPQVVYQRKSKALNEDLNQQLQTNVDARELAETGNTQKTLMNEVISQRAESNQTNNRMSLFQKSGILSIQDDIRDRTITQRDLNQNDAKMNERLNFSKLQRKNYELGILRNGSVQDSNNSKNNNKKIGTSGLQSLPTSGYQSPTHAKSPDFTAQMDLLEKAKQELISLQKFQQFIREQNQKKYLEKHRSQLKQNIVDENKEMQNKHRWEAKVMVDNKQRATLEKNDLNTVMMQIQMLQSHRGNTITQKPQLSKLKDSPLVPNKGGSETKTLHQVGVTSKDIAKQIIIHGQKSSINSEIKNSLKLIRSLSPRGSDPSADISHYQKQLKFIQNVNEQIIAQERLKQQQEMAQQQANRVRQSSRVSRGVSSTTSGAPDSRTKDYPHQQEPGMTIDEINQKLKKPKKRKDVVAPIIENSLENYDMPWLGSKKGLEEWDDTGTYDDIIKKTNIRNAKQKKQSRRKHVHEEPKGDQITLNIDGRRPSDPSKQGYIPGVLKAKQNQPVQYNVQKQNQNKLPGEQSNAMLVGSGITHAQNLANSPQLKQGKILFDYNSPYKLDRKYMSPQNQQQPTQPTPGGPPPQPKPQQKQPVFAREQAPIAQQLEVPLHQLQLYPNQQPPQQYQQRPTGSSGMQIEAIMPTTSRETCFPGPAPLLSILKNPIPSHPRTSREPLDTNIPSRQHRVPVPKPPPVSQKKVQIISNTGHTFSSGTIESQQDYNSLEIEDITTWLDRRKKEVEEYKVQQKVRQEMIRS